MGKRACRVIRTPFADFVAVVGFERVDGDVGVGVGVVASGEGREERRVVRNVD